jgi:hypothetical protein
MVEVYAVSFYSENVDEHGEFGLEKIAKEEGIKFLERGSNMITYIPRDHEKLGSLIDRLSRYFHYVDDIHVFATEVEDTELVDYLRYGKS